MDIGQYLSVFIKGSFYQINTDFRFRYFYYRLISYISFEKLFLIYDFIYANKSPNFTVISLNFVVGQFL